MVPGSERIAAIAIGVHTEKERTSRSSPTQRSTVKSIQHAWKRAVEEAGIKATPHTLRHTRATWVMQDGDVPPWEAAGHLGMSLKTLQKYAKHSPDFQKRAAEV